MTIPLTFPPYLPTQGDQQVSPNDLQKAHRIWNYSLNHLLTSPSAFPDRLVSSHNLFGFLTTYLRFRRRSDSAEEKALDKKVYLLIYKIGQAIENDAVREFVARDLDVLALFDFAKWYGHMEDSARQIMLSFGSVPEIRDKMVDVFSRITHWLLTIGKKYGKRSKAAAKSSKNGAALPPEQARQLESHISTTSDLCLSIMALLNILPINVQQAMDYRSLLNTLTDFYDSTLPVIISLFEQTQGDSSIGRSNVHQNQVKMGMLHSIEMILDSYFFKPLNRTVGLNDDDDTSSTFMAPNPLHLQEVLESMIERAEIHVQQHSTVWVYKDAPLLFDLDQDYSLRPKLRATMDRFAGEEEAFNATWRKIADGIDSLVSRVNLKVRSDTARMLEIASKSPGGLAAVVSMGRRQSNAKLTSSNPDELPPALKTESLISQVQDLFPDLGDGFVIMCLRFYKNDVEKLIAALLDYSLPKELEALKRELTRDEIPIEDYIPPTPTLSVNHITRQAARMSMDEYASRPGIHIHSQDDKQEAPPEYSSYSSLPRPKPNFEHDKEFMASQKDKILAQVYDQYDDEYDDTYDDVDDMQGDRVASRIPKGLMQNARKDMEQDRLLFKAFEENKAVFERSKDARGSKERDELRKRTGLANEQIEGWAIMLQRNPKAYETYKQQFEAQDRRQAEESGSGTDDSQGQDSSSPSGTASQDQRRGRGRGRITANEREKKYRKKMHARKMRV